MGQAWVRFQDVTFGYETTSRPLLEGLTCHFPVGWTGIIGGNGVGKTTILRLATGALRPQQGRVTVPGRAIYCPQRTDDAPEQLGELVRATEADACEIRGRLAVEEDWAGRWRTLSHGERKRAQIGVALWLKPEVLALDEPTNHIDADARALLASALPMYAGAGLLVSHDRELLDALCGQCLFVEPPNGVMRPGGYTEGSQQAGREEEHRRRQRRTAKTAHARLRREAVRRRAKASRANRDRSKHGLGAKDHDARAKIDMARVTGRDARAGQLLSQLSGRLRQAEERLQHARVKKVHELGVWVPEARSKRDHLFRIAAGSIPLGADRRLRFPGLAMRPDSRVALTGPNGSGKSTLIEHIVSRLNVPKGKVTYIPQEIDLESSRRALDEMRGLRRDALAHAMTVVSRLNSRPERLLESEAPSPGEVRKLLLARGIAEGPHLIIMDEPTNHLDLPSIECLEQALDDCPCGLLLVSHDKRFLARLVRTTWRIVRESGGSRVVVGE